MGGGSRRSLLQGSFAAPGPGLLPVLGHMAELQTLEELNGALQHWRRLACSGAAQRHAHYASCCLPRLVPAVTWIELTNSSVALAGACGAAHGQRSSPASRHLLACCHLLRPAHPATLLPPAQRAPSCAASGEPIGAAEATDGALGVCALQCLQNPGCTSFLYCKLAMGVPCQVPAAGGGRRRIANGRCELLRQAGLNATTGLLALQGPVEGELVAGGQGRSAGPAVQHAAPNARGRPVSRERRRAHPPQARRCVRSPRARRATPPYGAWCRRLMWACGPLNTLRMARCEWAAAGAAGVQL